jgi:DNA polymerase elongation subunit (family B)
MPNSTFFPYSWHIDENNKDTTIIRSYGLGKNNENICIIINNFTPFVYLELPEKIPWTESKSKLVCNKIDSILGNNKPIVTDLTYKHKLYYAHLLPKTNKRKVFPYLFLSFASTSHIRMLSYAIRNPINIIGLGFIKLKMHEQDASPILQFTSYRNISTAGWVDFSGKLVPKEEQITLCDKEYIVKWKNVQPNNSSTVSNPLIMGFDIEVNSSNPSAMPKATETDDKVFQISCVLYRQSSDNTLEKYILTLGHPEQKITGDDVIIQMYDTEEDLLVGFTQFIQKHNPNVITGYNILNFDIPYMIDRSKKFWCIDRFSKMGFLKNTEAKERTIKWSSSAYGTQTFQFLDAEGRLFVDLLPLVKRDYKLNNYKLKTVSTFFLGSTKDPLSVKGIFKCYRIGIKKDNNGLYSKKAQKAMGLVSKYCIQDSALVVNLFNKLQTWIGLCEMANTCNVPIFFLYTQGQQIKVYSQLYKYCLFNNFVVEKDGYITKDNEHYVGALVFEPKPGVYDRVLPFDFASLYPTTIIAYNIDYSTLVIDDSIPDKDCHVMDWEDHQGCIHDTTVRSSKPKNIMCCKRHFRFLKEPRGVMPTVLQNLLDARAHTREQMKSIKKIISKSELSDKDIKLIQDLIPDIIKNIKDIKNEDIEYLKTLIEVLDKRQLAYKVSANSMYGAMGVTRGYLPFMPGAMATTAMGRQNISIVAKTIPEKFGGELVYGDTDSNYVVFPKLKTASENWDYAIHVSKEISKMFPAPIKLEFENAIYWRFFILTKKRYMYKKCGRDGVVSDEIGNKGVLLARRDNSMFIREVYSAVIDKVFNKEDMNLVIQYTIDEINKLCSHFYNYKNFVVTKAVGDTGDGKVIPFVDEKGKRKGKIGSYKVPILSTETKERQRQLKLKNCNSEKEYYERCLPCVVQLAERIRNRGHRVDTGSRLEYVITEQGGHKGKQYEKVEDADYFKQFSTILKIDYLYYLKLMANPFDDIFNIMYTQDKIEEVNGITFLIQKGLEKDFVLHQYKLRLYFKEKVLAQLLLLFTPKIKFEN